MKINFSYAIIYIHYNKNIKQCDIHSLLPKFICEVPVYKDFLSVDPELLFTFFLLMQMPFSWSSIRSCTIDTSMLKSAWVFWGSSRCWYMSNCLSWMTVICKSRYIFLGFVSALIWRNKLLLCCYTMSFVFMCREVQLWTRGLNPTTITATFSTISSVSKTRCLHVTTSKY